MDTELITDNNEPEIDQTDDTTSATPTKAAGDDEMKRALAELAGTMKTLATPKAPAEREYTQDEINEYWAVYNPEKSKHGQDFFRKFFRLNPDATPDEVAEAKDLFADMQAGLARQSVTGAKRLMDKALADMEKKLEEKYAPVLEYYHSSQAEKIRGDFHKAYPVLEDARYAPILNASAQLLKGKTFDSNASYFKALAEGAAAAIKGIDPSFDLGSTVKPTTTPKSGTTPRLPRTSVGGTGGTGGGLGGLVRAGSSRDDFDSIDIDR